jgi:hypothetical protein
MFKSIFKSRVTEANLKLVIGDKNVSYIRGENTILAACTMARKCGKMAVMVRDRMSTVDRVSNVAGNSVASVGLVLNVAGNSVASVGGLSNVAVNSVTSVGRVDDV